MRKLQPYRWRTKRKLKLSRRAKSESGCPRPNQSRSKIFQRDSRWRLVEVEDATQLYEEVLEQLAVDHQKMIAPYFQSTTEEWKALLGNTNPICNNSDQSTMENSNRNSEHEPPGRNTVPVPSNSKSHLLLRRPKASSPAFAADGTRKDSTSSSSKSGEASCAQGDVRVTCEYAGGVYDGWYGKSQKTTNGFPEYVQLDAFKKEERSATIAKNPDGWWQIYRDQHAQDACLCAGEHVHALSDVQTWHTRDSPSGRKWTLRKEITVEVYQASSRKIYKLMLDGSKSSSECAGVIVVSVSRTTLPADKGEQSVQSIDIEKFIVFPKFRKLGVARSLCGKVLRALRPGVEEIQDIWISVFDLNWRASKAYLSMGFTIIDSYEAQLTAHCKVGFLQMRQLLGKNALRFSMSPKRMLRNEIVGELLRIRMNEKEEEISTAEVLHYDLVSGRHLLRIFLAPMGFRPDNFVEVDLNDFFRRGLLIFQRPLTLRLNNVSSSCRKEDN